MASDVKHMKKSLAVALIALTALASSTACAEREPYRRASTLEERARGDALAEKMIEALGGQTAWDAIALVSFDFRASLAGIEAAARHHDWDKARGLLRIVDEGGARVTHLDLWDRTGASVVDGEPLEGEALAARLEEAWAHFINDSYWFIAPFKVFDEGAVRADVDGKLRITFEKAVGLTPGDAYLYTLDERGAPRAWSFLLESGLSGSMDFVEPRVFEGVTVFAKKRASESTGIAFEPMHLSRSSDDTLFAPLLARRVASKR